MRKIQHVFFLPVIVCSSLFLFCSSSGGAREKSAFSPPARSGVYLNLTEDFYRALREESDRGARSYSTDRSDEYLRQIAVSTKFMVETNIHIIKQQETIIQLLESLAPRKKSLKK